MKKTPNLISEYNRLFKESNRNLINEEGPDGVVWRYPWQQNALDDKSREGHSLQKKQREAEAFFTAGIALLADEMRHHAISRVFDKALKRKK